MKFIDQNKFRNLYKNLSAQDLSFKELVKIACDEVQRYSGLVGVKSIALFDPKGLIPAAKGIDKIDLEADSKAGKYDLVICIDEFIKDEESNNKLLKKIARYSDYQVFIVKSEKVRPFKYNEFWWSIEFRNMLSESFFVEESFLHPKGEVQFAFCSKFQHPKKLSYSRNRKRESLSSIAKKDITFVIHGAIIGIGRNYEWQYTKRAIDSIRKHYPGSKIILSTWYDYNQEYIETLGADEVVFSCDPGGQEIIDAAQKNAVITSSVNRHIKSSYAGMRKVKTKYAACLRSDLEFFNDNLINNYIKYEKLISPDIFEMPIAVESYGTKKGSSFFGMYPFPFHPCDFCYFGFTTDIKNLFDIPYDNERNGLYFIENLKPSSKKSLFQRRNDELSHRHVPEAFVLLEYINKNKLRHINYPHRFYKSNSPENEVVNKDVVFNNFILLDTSQYGFYWLSLKRIMWKLLFIDTNSRYIFDDWKAYVSKNIICKSYYIIRGLIRRMMYLFSNIVVCPLKFGVRLGFAIVKKVSTSIFSIENLRN